MEASLPFAPRSVLKLELAARAASSPLYAGLAEFTDEALRSQLTSGSVLKGQHGPDDDRHEPYVYGNQRQQLCADGVAAIVPGSGLVNCGHYWTLACSSPCPANEKSLCAWERFSRQPRFGCDVNQVCAWSGCLVHERYLLTCWHGHERIRHEPYYAVFGFVTDQDEYFQPRFLARDVVPITEMVCGNGFPHSKEEDWAILRLAAPVKHRPVLDVAEMPQSWWAGKPEVYTLGHPIDLPMKLTDRAWAAPHPAMPARFVAPLDTYGGCSGSPVIAVTDDGRHVVMGIVVTGQLNEPNFDKCDTCKCWYRHVYRYDFPKVIGQSCTRARVFEQCIATLHQS